MKYWKVILLVAVVASLGFGDSLKVWVETTQKDFSDGIYEHNIYATHRAFNDSLPGDIEFSPRWDYNQDGYGDVTVSTVGTGYTAGTPSRDPSYIYLGGPGGFDQTQKLEYSIGSVGAMGGADLNLDGYTDLLTGIIYFYSSQGVSPCGLSIFWGTANGPDPNNVTPLGTPNFHAEAFYVADLNKDGYLDIIYASYRSYSDFAIIWGTPTGYSDTLVTVIPAPGGAMPRHNFEVADMDNNGYLDIIVTCFHAWGTPTARPSWAIFWGDSTGFLRTRFTMLSSFGIQAHGLSVADLNNDGWLDVVGTTYRSGDAGPGPDNSMVWYGQGNRQFSAPTLLIPGNCFGGSIVADLYPRGNPDGWPDIVFLSGNISAERYPIWLYYNDGKGGFSDTARVKLEALSARDWSTSGGFISDLEPRDGYLDMFINDWATLGQKSGVLYGPDFGKITELPNNVDHHGTFMEVGNTYSRKFNEDYISSVYDAESTVVWDGVFVVDSLPPGSGILMAVRTGNTSVPDNSWSGWYIIPYLPGPVPDSLASRYIQYKATLSYTNPAYLPVLYEVRITYPPGIEVWPDQVKSAASPDTVEFTMWVANLGTLTDTVNMAITGGIPTWPKPGLFRTLLDSLTDTNGDGIPDVPKVPPLKSDSVQFVVKVYVPAGVPAGVADTIVVWGTSTEHPSARDSAVLITIISPQVFIWVEPNRQDTTDPGVPANYNLYAKNDGNSEEIIDLKLTKFNWPVNLFEADGTTPLADHNSDGIPDIPQVAAKDSVWFVAQVTPPAATPRGSRDTTLIWGYSSIDTMPTQGQGKDSVQLVTIIPILVTFDTIIDTTVSIKISPVDSGYIYRPDTSIVYPLWLVNKSTIDSTIIRIEPNETTTVFQRTTPLFLPLVSLPMTINPATTIQGPWVVTLLDALGDSLKDTNSDGSADLTSVWPDTTRFQLRVVAPESLGYIVGAADPTKIVSTQILAKTAFKAIPDSLDALSDTTQLNTTLVPPLDVHNYPNPFPGHRTTFIFSLPDDGMVTLRIFNRAGELIKTLIKDKFYGMGVHTIPWDGKNDAGQAVAPGIYLYPFFFKASGLYHNTGPDYTKGKTIIKKAVLLP
jgi:hypothetical protein